MVTGNHALHALVATRGTKSKLEDGMEEGGEGGRGRKNIKPRGEVPLPATRGCTNDNKQEMPGCVRASSNGAVMCEHDWQCDVSGDA